MSLKPKIKKPVGRERGTDFSGIAKKIKPVGKIQKPMRVALYGRAGSGKTTLACSFPKPLLLDVNGEEGTDSVSDVKGLQVLPVQTWEDFEQLYWFLENGDHDFETVIVDTVTNLQELAIREVASANKKKDADGGWGTMSKQMWGEVSSMLKTWITNFRNLPDLNVVFLAQERLFNAGDESENDDGQIAPEVGPRMMPSVGSTLNAAVDLVGHCFIREEHKRVKDKNGKVKEVRNTQYCLRIGPHAYYTTKIRKPRDAEVPSFLIDATYDDLVELKNGE